MDTLLFIAERGVERFEIVREDGGRAYYVFRYENERNTHDHYQTDIPMCHRCAMGEHGVLEAAWRKPTEQELATWQKRQAEWENSTSHND